jgi:hypothetical protein
MLPWTFGIRVSRTAQATGALAIAQLRLKSPKPSLEGRGLLAIALGLDALVIGNHREIHRPAITARSLSVGAGEQPDQILVHRAVIGPSLSISAWMSSLVATTEDYIPDLEGAGKPMLARLESVSFYTISNCWTRAMRR